MPDERDLVGATLSAGPDQIPHVGTAEGVGSSLIVPHAVPVAVGAPRAGAVVSGPVTSGGYSVPVAGTHTQVAVNDERDVTAPGSPAWWAARQDRAEPVRRVPITLDRMGWRQVLEELAHAMRTALSAHPNVAAVFATAVPVGPNSLRGRELTLRVLRERGFDKTLAADAYTALPPQVL